jgi:AcrR family transcriptional regulator
MQLATNADLVLEIRDRLIAAGMIAEREPEDAESTRARLLVAAISLFADRGFHACTMRDLAGAVGVKAPAIYNHFQSKEQILAEASREALRRFFTRVIGPMSSERAGERLHGIVSRWVMFQISEREVALANDALLDTGALRQILDPVDWEPIHESLRDLIALIRLLVLEVSDGAVDARVLVHALTAVCDRAGLWFRRDRELSAEDVAEQTWIACRRMITGNGIV